MRLGQSSLLVFASKLLASLLGFLTTLYFARILGAEVLGYYAVVLALVSWLKFGGSLGVSQALVKRVSEGEMRDAYFTAGVLWLTLSTVLLTAIVLVFRGYIDAYVGTEVWHYVVLMLITGLLLTFVRSMLNGLKKVHIAGLLTPTNLIISSLIQISLVYYGYGLPGMLVGFLLGELATIIIASRFIPLRVDLPSTHHFRSMYNYAKYAWISGVKLRAYNDVDILVLSAFVSPSLVGIYSVAWSLAKFLSLFGTAIRSVVFPEISSADAADERERIAQLTTDSIAFGGLISIPGLFGGAVLGDSLLQLYGQEFIQGSEILVLLILATLIYSYQQQLMSVINAIDRADITFRINGAFIITNLVLNVVLISWVGWIGAAVATVVSAGVGLVLAFIAIRSLVDFDIPLRELGLQIMSAATMTIIVIWMMDVLESTQTIPVGWVKIVLLAFLGAMVYFFVLTAVSQRFRDIVKRNMPDMIGL